MNIGCKFRGFYVPRGQEMLQLLEPLRCSTEDWYTPLGLFTAGIVTAEINPAAWGCKPRGPGTALNSMESGRTYNMRD
jgi:hypothetical protein